MEPNMVICVVKERIVCQISDARFKDGDKINPINITFRVCNGITGITGIRFPGQEWHEFSVYEDQLFRSIQYVMPRMSKIEAASDGVLSMFQRLIKLFKIKNISILTNSDNFAGANFKEFDPTFYAELSSVMNVFGFPNAMRWRKHIA